MLSCRIMATPFSRNREAGFTLIEIILVIFILSLVAGLALPNFGPVYEGLQLKKTAEDLAYVMRYAQSRAIIKNRELRLEFDDPRSRYWLTQQIESSQAEGGAQERPFKKIQGRLGRVYEIPGNLTLETEHPTLSFYPDGRMDKQSLSVCRQDHCFILSTKEQRGRVRIFETRPE